MKMIFKILFISSLFIAAVAKAQQPSIKAFDIDLANYEYPFLFNTSH